MRGAYYIHSSTIQLSTNIFKSSGRIIISNVIINLKRRFLKLSR